MSKMREGKHMESGDKRRRWKRGRVSHLIISFRSSQGGVKTNNANYFNQVIELDISVLDIIKLDNTCLAMWRGEGQVQTGLLRNSWD